MPANSTTRFSSRVANYVRFRPGYPPALVELLAREAGLTPAAAIADIGSGTGLLAKVFLEAGYSVTGVEPNREMRQAGDQLLSAFPAFRSVEGAAEATNLPGDTFRLAVAGQALHWFDVPSARAEWVRILQPGGVAALIWNERYVETPFMRDVEALIDHYAAEMDSDGSIREAGRSRIPAFFAPSAFRLDEFPNSQRFGLEGLTGRIASCSFLPNAGDPRYDQMSRDLEAIFHRYENSGEVRFDYRTKVFHGRLGD